MLEELKRLRAELITLALCFAVFYWAGISRANFETIIFKVALVALASTIAHISRQLVFSYISLGDCIFGVGNFERVPVPIRATVAGGVFAVYSVLILAVVWAI